MFINYGMQIAPSAKSVMSCSATPPPGLEGRPAVLSRRNNNQRRKQNEGSWGLRDQRGSKRGGCPEVLEETLPLSRALGDASVDFLWNLGPEGQGPVVETAPTLNLASCWVTPS